MNKKEDEKQTFCFDLDGTLCSQRHLDYENAEPFNDRIKKVNELYDEEGEDSITTDFATNEIGRTAPPGVPADEWVGVGTSIITADVE